MHTIEELIEGIKGVEIFGSPQCGIASLSYDSRSVERDGCFFAVVGTQSDGHHFIESAIERGACAVVCEHLPERLHDEVSYVVVPSAQEAMGAMAANLYDHPSRELKLVGVTGTNGKTTTATLLCDLFNLLGYKTGLISTVEYRIGGEQLPSTHTTPDAIRLQMMMRQMVDRGCDYCFMEVSSHSIVQQRIEGLHFAGAIFTNLTHDHLDYHGTFAAYRDAKKGLFDSLDKGAFAVVNIDDRNGDVMVQNCSARVESYSLRSMADHRAKVIEMHFDGMLLEIDGRELWVRVMGRFNAYNLLAIYSAACALGIGGEEVMVAMSELHSVSGRFEHISAAGGRTVVIDYAHTPDALEKVLESIHEIAHREVITVCGCGGERDREKRPEMARVAYMGSSTVIFTSDNPRSEDPESIIAEMVEGLKGVAPMEGRRYLKITNRSEAIRTAITLSGEGAVVVVAGKGHEKYQIIGDQKRPFDDHEEVKDALKQLIINH